MLYHIISYHNIYIYIYRIISYYIILHHIISYCNISSYIISYYIISCYIILYHIISYYISLPKSQIVLEVWHERRFRCRICAQCGAVLICTWLAPSFVALSLYQSRCGAVLMLTVQTLVTGAPWVALIFSRSSFELILRDRGKDN